MIFIRDGSLLDAAGLRLIAEMAAANNFQVWMEDARSADPAAIVIEDGHVKETAVKETAVKETAVKETAVKETV